MLGLLLAIGACLPVSGDRILMRDLAAAVPAFASVDGEEAVGFAPVPGSQRVFQPAELGRIAARKGIAAESGSVCFEREMESLTRERVLTALRDSLPAGAELELIEFSAGRLPKGPLEFLKSGLTPAPAGSPRTATVWRGRVRYGGSRTFAVWARVRVWTSRETVVAAENLTPGRPVEEGQVRIEKRDANPFAESPAGTVVGMSLRRPIRAGSAIPLAALEKAADVARGDKIEIESRYGAALVRMEGRAEAAGRAGDWIPARNVSSGKRLRVRVVGPGVAEAP